MQKPVDAAVEVLNQVWEGYDFPPVRRILSNVKAEDAAARPTSFKYSMLTLVEHSRFWQEIWLCRLRGGKRPDMTKDWRVPEPNEWPEIRKAFLAGFEEALAIAKGRPFAHQAKSDDAAIRLLTQIAVHNAYHVGQMVLVKRAVRGEKEL